MYHICRLSASDSLFGEGFQFQVSRFSFSAWAATGHNCAAKREA
jgi:hypothetical protein